MINDIHEDTLDRISNTYNATIVRENLYDLDMDIYAPCALGATVNDETIGRLKAEVIAGAANNQLADELRHGTMLREKGIVYAPDFLINAGGLINVYSEIAKYDRAEALRRTEDIYNTTLTILTEAETHGITTHQAALKVAEERVAKKREQQRA